MSDRTKIQRKKADTSTVINSSVASLGSPTLISLKPAFGVQSFGHDISRISLRPQTKLEASQPQDSHISIFSSAPNAIQTKLTVGEPNDQYEQEADRVADEVISMNTSIDGQTIRRDLDDENEEDKTEVSKEEWKTQQPSSYLDFLQLKPSLQREVTDASFDSSTELETQLTKNVGGGSQLPKDTRSFMESRFGFDFDKVRVHTDHESIQMNQELGAQAFTYGQDIFFGSGKYNPTSNSGKWLLAHELTHVVQQTGGVNTKLDVQESTEPKKIGSNQRINKVETKSTSEFGNSYVIQRQLEKLVDNSYIDFLNWEFPISTNSKTAGDIVQQKCNTCEAEESLFNTEPVEIQSILGDKIQKLVELSTPNNSIQLSPSCWAEKFNLVAAITALIAAAGVSIAAILAPDPTTITKWAALGLIAGVISAIAWVINGIISLIACLESDPDANRREIEQLRRRQEQLERTVRELRQVQGQQPAPNP